jgi:hypothetical protein
MNIIYKLGYKKYYIGSYLLSFIAIIFYVSLYFSEKLYDFIELQTNDLYNAIPFLDLRLSLYILAFIVIAIVFLIFSLIKCPNCNYKIFWSWFINSRQHKNKGNPLTIGVCPNCNYDPDEKNHPTSG